MVSVDVVPPGGPEEWFGGDVLQLFSLAGKRALVTGAGRGIGRAIAIGMAQAGAAVVLTARSTDQLDETTWLIEKYGGTAYAVPADLSSSESIPSLVDAAERLLGGTVEIVAHSAGIQHREAASSFSADAWSRVLQVNLTAPFLLSQEVGRRQILAGCAGNHVFVASLSSVIGLQNAIGYNAAKSGLMGVVRGLSREWSRHGIRVNALGPGYVETAMTEDLMADDVTRENLLRQIPMDRFASPEEFAAPAVFLASEASRYMTGHLLFVDGGASSI